MDFTYRDAVNTAKSLSLSQGFWQRYYNHLIDMNDSEQEDFEDALQDAGIESDIDFILWVEA